MRKSIVTVLAAAVMAALTPAGRRGRRQHDAVRVLAFRAVRAAGADTDRGPANVLILQNLRDPATPLAGARQLRKALATGPGW